MRMGSGLDASLSFPPKTHPAAPAVEMLILFKIINCDRYNAVGARREDMEWDRDIMNSYG